MCVVENSSSEMSVCTSSRNEVTSTRPSTTRVNESRKIRKPLMEKKRRARINESLNTLKRMLMEANKQTAADGRPAKLEKADILELTVQHLQQLHRQYDIAKSETEKENEITSTHSKTENLNKLNSKNTINTIAERLIVTTAHQNVNNNNKTYHLKVRIPNGITLVPTKLSNGDFAFILPAEMSNEMSRQSCSSLQSTRSHSVQTDDQIWRPW